MQNVGSLVPPLARAFVAVSVLLGLTACGARAGAGTAASAADIGVAVDLPALVIDIDAQGEPYLGDIPFSQVDDAFEPGALDMLAIGPEAVQFLTDRNIQHIQVSNTPTGVLILVNGKPAPSLAWDAETLAATADLASTALVDIPLLEPLLHLSSRLGLGILVRFPVAPGNQPIPALVTDGEGTDHGEGAASADQQPSMTIPIYYEADGSWRVGDLTDTEWSSLTGLPWYALRLQTPVIEGAIAAGIETIELRTDAAGIHVGINGRKLPYIRWSDGEMEHALALAGQLGAWESVAASGYDGETLRTVLATLLPIVQSADATVVVHFPTRTDPGR